MKRQFSSFSLVIACVLSVVFAGLCFMGFFVLKLGGVDSFPYATKFAAVFSAIENDYVGEADMEEVSDAAYSAMISSINDRWSYYMNSDEYESYKDYQKNNYTGIGVTIEADEESGLLKIVAVLEDSPASQAGVLIGDMMSSIDGQSLKNMTTAEVKTLIAEKQGKSFELALVAQDGTERSVTISSETIHTNPVKYELLDNGIGYVKIKNFEGDSGQGTIDAVDELKSQGAKGIIFDVRNNPGGLLSELIKALDHILPEGDLFVSADKEGNENVKTSDADCVELPMVVLLNDNSYSAAEFFGAALSEYEWAKLVGTHTTGKARSQVNIELTDGSAVHLSTNRYLTPNRVDLAEQGGLSMDVEVDLNEEDEAKLLSGVLAYEDDEQLSAAIEAMNALINK